MESPAASNPMGLSHCDRKQLLWDLFHALNQPLTTLRCSLELAIHQPYTAEQYRESVGRALEHAEHITQLTAGIRELLEAEDPGENAEVLELDVAVQRAVMDFLPVAESMGVQLRLQRSFSCRVLLDPLRLRQALFRLLDFVLHAHPTGGSVGITVGKQGDETLLRLQANGGTSPRDFIPATQDAGMQPKALELAGRLELGIARATFEAVSGSFRVQDGANDLLIEVRLPLALLPS